MLNSYCTVVVLYILCLKRNFNVHLMAPFDLLFLLKIKILLHFLWFILSRARDLNTNRIFACASCYRSLLCGHLNLKENIRWKLIFLLRKNILKFSCPINLLKVKRLLLGHIVSCSPNFFGSVTVFNNFTRALLLLIFHYLFRYLFYFWTNSTRQLINSS